MCSPFLLSFSSSLPPLPLSPSSGGTKEPAPRATNGIFSHPSLPLLPFPHSLFLFSLPPFFPFSWLALTLSHPPSLPPSPLRAHDWYLRIQLEKPSPSYRDALAYLSSLPFLPARHFLSLHGQRLLHALPEETTGVLMALCTGQFPPSLPSLPPSVDPKPRAPAEDFLHLFVEHPKWLRAFLECVMREPPIPPSLPPSLLRRQRRRRQNIQRERPRRFFHRLPSLPRPLPPPRALWQMRF